MKGKLKVFLSAAMAIFLFAGCSNISGLDKSVEGADADEKCVLTIGAKGYEDLSTQSGARTINPTAYTQSEAFSKITIQGTSSKGVALTETPLTFTSGQAQITLGYDIWYLTLTAYKSIQLEGETEATNHAVLMGRSVINLKRGVSTLEFELSTDGVTTPGTLTLGGDFKDTNNKVVNFSAGLYDIFTDVLVTGSEKTNIAVTEGANYATDKKKEFAYAKTQVAPGRYMFKIRFYMNTAASGSPANYQQIGFWSNEVVIAPGRDTSDTALHLPDIIDTLPVAPSAFTVSYENDSDTAGKYTAVLNWTDNSTNEENFVIKVMEFDAWDAAATAATSTIYLGIEDDATNHKYVFYSSPYRKDGTLNVSQSSCKLTLEAGKLYDFEIAAQNSLGDSGFVARDTTATTAPAGCTLYAAANKVTRTRITYNLNGGVLTLADDTVKNNNYEKYYTYAGSALTLLTVNASTGDAKTLVTAAHNPFKKWVDPNDATGTEVTTYDSWQNKIFKASYDETIIVTYTINDSYGSITAAAVYASTAADVASSTASCKNAIIDASAGNPYIKFSVTPAGTETYDSIQVRIGELIYSADSDTIIVNTNDHPLDSKTYCVVVLAHNAADVGQPEKLNSDVFAITIQR